MATSARPPRAPRLGPAKAPPCTDDDVLVVAPYYAISRGRWTHTAPATRNTSRTVFSLYMPRDEELESLGVENAKEVGHAVHAPLLSYGADGMACYLWSIDSYAYDLAVPREQAVRSVAGETSTGYSFVSPNLRAEEAPSAEYATTVVPGVQLKRGVAVLNVSTSKLSPTSGVRASVVIEVGSGYVLDAQAVRLEPRVAQWWAANGRPRSTGTPRAGRPLSIKPCEVLARVTRAPHNSHGFLVLYHPPPVVGATVELTEPRAAPGTLVPACRPLATVKCDVGKPPVVSTASA